MREKPKPFVYQIVDENVTPDLEKRLNEAFSKAYHNQIKENKGRQVLKEIFEYYDKMTPDQRALLLAKHPDIKAQMTIEEINLFIETGEIPEELLDLFK
jgi:hypothetical protein